jgi:hypothetical protein
MPARPWRALSRPAIAGCLIAVMGVLGLDATTIAAVPAHASGPPISDVATDPLVRLLNWSGQTWVVYPSTEPGPQGDTLTNSPQAVYVDDQGRLHLNLIQVNGKWRAVVMQSLNKVSYGTYQAVVDSPVARFSPETVFGFFVYKLHTKRYTNELDIEDAKFPHLLVPPQNSVFSVQPYYAPGNTLRYHVGASVRQLYQAFTWNPPSHGLGVVDFESRAGALPTSPLIVHWHYKGYSDPPNRNMYLYVTLWLNQNRPPGRGLHSVIVQSLQYFPLSK